MGQFLPEDHLIWMDKKNDCLSFAAFEDTVVDLPGRKRMEDRYGEVGSGGTTIVVKGTVYPLKKIFSKWMMDVPEVWTIDGGVLGEDRYWIRFHDADDRCVAVFEFDGDFEILSETRVDSMAWEGEDFFTSRTR
jgi:hypothetical protein